MRKNSRKVSREIGSNDRKISSFPKPLISFAMAVKISMQPAEMMNRSIALALHLLGLILILPENAFAL
jgi:hypothetical protein